MRRAATGLLGVAILILMVGWTAVHPSHDRDWLPEQRLLPRAEFAGSLVTIHNMRDFRWGPGAHVAPGWTTQSYPLSGVASVWYILTPFSRDRRGPAHAFVSFGFDDGRFLAISVEARREVGEEYSVVRGMAKQFELMYVIGDERDLVQLRVARGDDVYVYPMRATRAQARDLLTDMLERANALHEEPEFYGTLRNNCTTNLLRHVNTIALQPIRYGRKVLLPGYSDEIAHARGLIDTDLPLDSARMRFRVNGRARQAEGRSTYSQIIRSVEDLPR